MVYSIQLEHYTLHTFLTCLYEKLNGVRVMYKMGIRLPAHIVGMIASLLRYNKTDYCMEISGSASSRLLEAEDILKVLKNMEEAFTESDACVEYIDQVNLYIQNEIAEASTNVFLSYVDAIMDGGANLQYSN